MNTYKIHNNLSLEECSYAINIFNGIISNYAPSYCSVGDTRIFGFERFIDTSLTDKILSLDARFIFNNENRKPIYQTLMFNHTYFDLNAKGSGEGWHRDSCLQKQYKTIFYLVPVTINNGPFRVFLKPNIFFNSLFKYKRRFSDRFVNLFYFFLGSVKVFTSSTAGLGFSINTNLLHRGTKIVSGERYAITVYSYLDHPDENIYKLASTDLSLL
jgi:hypothetical protein